MSSLRCACWTIDIVLSSKTFPFFCVLVFKVFKVSAHLSLTKNAKYIVEVE